MPDALDAAVQALTAEGVAPDVARRAAVAALWMETGPSHGFEATPNGWLLHFPWRSP